MMHAGPAQHQQTTGVEYQPRDQQGDQDDGQYSEQ